MRSLRQAMEPDADTPDASSGTPLDAGEPPECVTSSDCLNGNTCVGNLCLCNSLPKCTGSLFCDGYSCAFGAIDAGPIDGGNLASSDAGYTASDAGTAPGLDAGNPSTDAGSGTADGGTPPVGGGTGTTGGGSGNTGGGSGTGGGTGSSQSPICSSNSGGSGIGCLGATGSQLGWSVSLCSEGVFAAGAPGTNSVMNFNGSMMWTGLVNAQGSVGEAVLCRPSASTLVAGQGGIWEVAPQSTPEQLWPQAAFALALMQDAQSGSSTVYVTGEMLDGTRTLMQWNGTAFTNYAIGDAPSGDSLAVTPDGVAPIIVTGAPGTNNGVVTTYSSSSSQLQTGPHTTLISPHAGVAIATGDVWPDSPDSAIAKNEILVASQDFLFILRSDFTPITKIAFGTAITSSAGLPVSIAIDDTAISSRVHGFWVGLPGSNKVIHCIGSACSPWKTGAAGSDFGASIAQLGSNVIVGAPSTENGRGAVFLYSRDLSDVFGEDLACTAGESCCTSRGISGTCVGGVMCMTGAPANQTTCSSTDGGAFNDAGVTDAGITGEDAGTVDGGSNTDGGAQPGDVGPAQFAAQGCSAAPGAWALALAVLALRRVKRGS